MLIFGTSVFNFKEVGFDSQRTWCLVTLWIMVNPTQGHSTPSHELEQTGCPAGIARPSREPGRWP